MQTTRGANASIADNESVMELGWLRQPTTNNLHLSCAQFETCIAIGTGTAAGSESY